jgi:hypothetical protein
MNESEGYVVYFFPQALEALGDAIKPYLREGPGGEHVLCHEVDTAGSLIEMTIEANTPDGPLGLARTDGSAGDGEDDRVGAQRCRRSVFRRASRPR